MDESICPLCAEPIEFTIKKAKLTLTKSGLQVDLQKGPAVVVVDADGSNAKLLEYTGP